MKKLICLLLAVLLLAALTACGKTQPAESSPAYTVQPAESAPANTAQPAESAPANAAQPAESAPANTAQPAPAETPGAGTQTAAPSVKTMTAWRADGSTVILEDCGDGTWKDENGSVYYPGEDGVLRARGAEDLYTERPSAAANTPEPERQDSERREAVIEIEGIEETVQYEHIRNDTIGFEMDYDYESFVRQSESVCERFISVWDDPADPENYLEISSSAETAETVAASVIESLSDDYDILRESRTLDRAGSCIMIEAAVIKGTNNMADQLQVVYIIPTADGCRIAAEHFSSESAEGFGRRFSYMLNTLEVIGRTDSYAESADAANAGELPDGWTGEDFGEQPDYEYEWTGEDFGELPPEDFGEQPDYEYEWTGEDFGELPPEDFFTGEDYGELPPEDFYTGVDYGELPPEDFGE